MIPLKKELDPSEIELARRSVSDLNIALKEEISRLKSPRLLIWAGDFHLHQDEPYGKGLDHKYERIDCSRELDFVWKRSTHLNLIRFV